MCSAYVEYGVNGTGKFATAQVPWVTGVSKSLAPGCMANLFVWWCLIFVGPQCGTYFMSVMVPRIVRRLLGFWKICVSLKWYIISWSLRKLHFLLPLSNPSSQPNCSAYYLVMAGFIFRSICKVAKSACWLYHVCPCAWDVLALAGQIFVKFALFTLLL